MENKLLEFTKYQGTGNDFIIIDDRKNIWNDLPVAHLCDRKFGIGADGLMLLKLSEGYDFKMVYYNSDGNLSSMCGNGGRCIAHFAYSLGLGFGHELNFIAVDGPHKASIDKDHVELEMIDVGAWDEFENHTILDTGSPHYVQFLSNYEQLKDLNIIEEARKIRYAPTFAEKGINVNFVVKIQPHEIAVRTYERGVEAETLSCGTGVTASAIAYALKYPLPHQSDIQVQTPGGKLKVSWNQSEPGVFTQVKLYGPVKQVFTGVVDLP